MPDENDFRPGDLEHTLLRKILNRTKDSSDDAAAAAVAIVATATVTAASTAASAAALEAIRTAIPAVNPFFLQGLVGEINGREAQALHIKGRRAGFNSSNVLQDIAEFLGTTIDLMPELTGSEALEIVSSSTSDSAAGTGTRTIEVTYIDTSNNMVQSASITLNGTTPVPAGFQARFILWMSAITGGSSETSVGAIILRVVAGDTQEQISAGDNRSLSGRFMVPAGFTAYIPYWQTTAIGGATQDSRLRATVDDFNRDLQDRYVLQDHAFVQSGQAVTNDLPWLQFPSLCRIKVSTIPSATPVGNRVDTDFSVLLVAN